MTDIDVSLGSIAARERKHGNAQLADILDGLVIAIEQLRAENERLRELVR